MPTGGVVLPFTYLDEWHSFSLVRSFVRTTTAISTNLIRSFDRMTPTNLETKDELQYLERWSEAQRIHKINDGRTVNFGSDTACVSQKKKTGKTFICVLQTTEKLRGLNCEKYHYHFSSLPVESIGGTVP